MALELIQNADDAKAEEIVFDITDEGLHVSNNGKFTYCGDLNTRPCKFQERHNYGCDYHRIADVGSGGKLSRGENIGRFGIGFVSTYQVTDHPEIHSDGISLTLHPEEGKWFIESFNGPAGTSFYLPWARDPNTEARRELGVSHISDTHIDQLAEDFQSVIREGLLFLRHVRKAEVRRKSRLLLSCELDRGEDSDLIVSFMPSGEVEQWHILRTDAANAADLLYKTHPRLKSLHRSTKISIGLRIEPEHLTDGLLYAYLPTEQSTGLPLHINADFYPEPDRKAVIFAGHQHEQAWNEMLIEVCAAELVREPENLLQMLGDVQFWRILDCMYNLFKSSNYPDCFKQFWEHMKSTAAKARITPTQDGTTECPCDVFFSDEILKADQAKALKEVGGKVVVEKLRPFRTVINQLGAPLLTLDRLVDLLEPVLTNLITGSTKVEYDRLETLYKPLWNIISDILPKPVTLLIGSNPAVKRLQELPVFLTEDLHMVTANNSYMAPPTLESRKIATLLPRLSIASSHIFNFSKLNQLFRTLKLSDVALHLSTICEQESVEKVLSVEKKDLRDLYSLFADLDGQSTVENSVYLSLQDTPIWLSSRELISATQALLPGNFTDPTGQTNLLDISLFTESAIEFVSNKLGVEIQTIEAFVNTVLPTFFNDDGPRNEDGGPLNGDKYARLVEELAKHTTLVNDEYIRRLIGSLPLAPTQDGNWSSPTNIYRRTDELTKILGDAKHLWLDVNRIPNTRSVNAFIDNLGIRRSPIARHLVDRMLYISEKFLPTEEAKIASGEAFYVLCDKYEEWKENPGFQEAIADLRRENCFPANGDSDSWYSPDLLHAPYRAEAFQSQANILAFRNTGRLKTDLLEVLNISINPETQLVINHLEHCVNSGVSPHITTYQVLNERAQRPDPLVSTLAGSRCIYVENQDMFVRPNQLYWTPQPLGRYAFTIPKNLESFKPLFDDIGVKTAPVTQDLIEILLDIIGEHYEKSILVNGADRAIYDNCFEDVALAHGQEELNVSDLVQLRKAPSILNLQDTLTHPDEILLQDSEWHASFFNGELDRALTKPKPELWPLIEEIGVRKLSDSAQVRLEFFDGPLSDETSLAECLAERMDILIRLLCDKSAKVRDKVRKAISELKAVSYDVVRIQAFVQVGGDEVSAPPTPAQAFYDIESGRLILSRPVNDRSWAHILNALFHQLMLEESGSEISKLTLSVRPLMGMTVEEADRELTDAGIPNLDVSEEVTCKEELTSANLDEMGATTETTSNKENEELSSTAKISSSEGSEFEPIKGSEDENAAILLNDKSPNGTPRQSESSRHGEGFVGNGNSTTSRDSSNRNSEGQQRKKKPRPKHKEQWDRRLLSYVHWNQKDSPETKDQESLSEHNLAVEVMARNAVCAYEKVRGRIAEQMAQTHPGHDIISHNPVIGEDRFIEVKGVNGEWNQTGVGLSRLQFSNAQDYGDRYWLYVVEFVSDPEHLRVYPIRSPATQVTSFMFDGNWRDAATEESEDPTSMFIPGARIHHQGMGSGEIRDITVRGSTKLLTILFDGKSQSTPNVTLNLYRMRILDESDDDVNS